jgi:histidinol-phosphatase (PHP family)
LKKHSWRISLHGGHSSAYCDHADDPLDTLVSAAVEAGFHTYGITEHAPRFRNEDLYAEELELGWTVETLLSQFEAYAAELDRLVQTHAHHLHLLKGFEAEVIPAESYKEKMLHLKNTLNFDYMVGSVHYVHEISIDYTQAHFEDALDRCGGLEKLAQAYYEHVQIMVEDLKPDIVGHFDLIRKLAGPAAELESPDVLRAAENALETIRETGCIVDVNTSPLRKGAPYPYPSPVFMKMIRHKNIPLSFGDDSHAAAHVGAGLPEARKYLLDHGIRLITNLVRVGGRIEKECIPLL